MTRPFFFPASDGTPLFGMWREASTQPLQNSMVWVVCAPFAEEEKSAHRTLFELCEALGARGESTLCFAYGGTGDSGGEFGAHSLISWREDILDACETARGLAPQGQIGLIGLRLGASLAAQVARAANVRKLILIEPVLNGRSYLMQLGARKKLRAAITEQGAEAQTPVTVAAVRSPIEDLDGWPVSSALREELNALDLIRDVPALLEDSEVLVLQAGPREQLAPPLQKFAQQLKAKNSDCKIETRAVVMPPFWNRLDLVVSTPLSEAVTNFEFGVANRGAKNREVQSPSAHVENSHFENSEQTVTFTNASGENLIGVYHSSFILHPLSPTIVMLHGWTGYRTGPHQMLVRAARRFSKTHNALRFDFSGRGDSNGKAEASTLATMQEDARAALDWLAREHGSTRVILLGLCSGCEVALATAALETGKIEKLVLWSAPVFAAGQSEERISRKRKSHLKDYARKILRPATWAKIMTGKVDVGGVGKVLQQGGGQESKNVESGEEGQLPNGWRENVLRKFKSFGAPALMLYGTGDPTTEEALQWHREVFAQRIGALAPDVRFIEGANHSFYGLNWEEAVFAETESWLQSQADAPSKA